MSSPQQQPSVYFSSLELKNVRCFGERQVLELVDSRGLPAQWTLLLGDNGVGKTTLLQCLAWMRPVLSGPQEGGNLDNIQPALTNEENEVLNSLLRAGIEITLDLKATLAVDQSFGCETLQQTPGAVARAIKTGICMEGVNNQLQKYSLTENSLPDGISAPDFVEPPVFAYGAARHMGISNLDKNEPADPLISLFLSSTELYDAEEILLNLDYRVLKQGKENGKDAQRLQKIKQVLATLLPDVSGEDDIRILGPKALVRSPGANGVLFNTPYGLVPLSGLSLGYQTTLAWALDLVTRLYKHYPDSNDPLKEPAIVLIDEIDLHLHPRWQRRIITYLTEHFPKTQFIATAHSPLMVQSAMNANLVVLRQNDGQIEIENRPCFVESWRVDQVLASELFGVPVRSPRIQRLVDERYELLNKTARNPSEEERLQALDEELGNLPTGSLEDNNAMDIIRQAAALLKEQKGASKN